MSLLPSFLTDSLDEVVFESRNQAYGAYQLRHDYQRNLTSAGGLTLAFCAVLGLGWVAVQHFTPVAAAIVSNPVCLMPIDITPPTIIEKPKVAVQAPPRARAAAMHPAPAIPTQVTKVELPQPHLTPPQPTDVVDGPTGPATPGATALGDPTALPGAVDSDGPGTATTAPASTEPFVYVEKMPEFAGGQAALLKYLRSHLHYPGKALAEGVGGRVFLTFVVGADGVISEVTILKGLGYGLDEEALRVVRQMPAWTPGYQSKHAVPVRFTLPITFQYQ
ncbi:TonB family protein [Hymenobacter sp. H14-R3]|uniref:energy transducer TonB n=1 Tax=Hymenobacter sp. H14-R3 TaxID=3046308 RepID=UPI0024BAD007|nr:energy transducer TonB [Hymenobacter sp. H14-R3]MDJ0363864.1 TonB family protein [Hymenobacter sp. H14-R3]